MMVDVAASVVLDGTEILKIVGAILVPTFLGFWHLSGRLTTLDVKVDALQTQATKTENAVFKPAWETQGVSK